MPRGIDLRGVGEMNCAGALDRVHVWEHRREICDQRRLAMRVPPVFGTPSRSDAPARSDVT